MRTIAGHISPEQLANVVRVLVLLTLIPASWLGIIQVTHLTVSGVVVLAGAYVLLLTFGPRLLGVLRRTDVIILLDLVLASAIVAVSGILESPFLLLFYLAILEAAARLNLRQALAAVLATTGLIVLLGIRAGHVEGLATAGFRLGVFIAGGFFLALFLGTLLQEARAARAREAWMRVLDRRLREATAQLKDQLEEMQYHTDLASRLAGELQVGRVLEILLQAVLDILGWTRGIVFLSGDEGTLHCAVTRGFSPGEMKRAASWSLPPLGQGVGSGDIVLNTDEAGHLVVCVPLIHADQLQALICGMEESGSSIIDPIRRRLRGIAAQGASALKAARLYEQVRQMASTDPLTGLANRRGFLDRFTAELPRKRQEESSVSIMLVDIDEFKLVNDVYGHATGDAVLIRVAEVLKNTIRSSDVAARFGGDEFVLLLPETKDGGIEAVANRLEALEIPIPGAGASDHRLHFSWGTATCPKDGDSVERLLHVADGRLYVLKDRKRKKQQTMRQDNLRMPGRYP